MPDWWTWSGSAKGAKPVPDLPRGAGWLMVEIGGETLAEAQAAAAALVRDAGALDSMVFPAGPIATAMWQIRADGAGLAGRTPDGRQAWPGWEDAAVPPANLGAYLREFEALMDAYDVVGLPYGHFGDGCIHVRIDLPLEESGEVFRQFIVRRRAPGGQARRVLLRRTRRRPGPQRTAADHVLTGGASNCSPASRPCSTRTTCSTPGCWSARPAIDADLRRPTASADSCRPAGSASPTTTGTSPRPCTAAWASASAGPTTGAAGGFMCPSYLASRDEKDVTRGRARVLQELTNGTLIPDCTSSGGARVAGPVPVLQGLCQRLPGRGRHGPVQVGGAAPDLQGAQATDQPLQHRLAAPLDLGSIDKAPARRCPR